MKIFAFLPDLRSYRDRFVMLQRAAERVGHMRLLTDFVPPDWPGLAGVSPALTLEPLVGRRVPRPAFVPLLWRAARARLAAEPFDVVHDHSGYLWPLFAELRLRGGRRPRLLSSSFASIHEWFRVLRHAERSGWATRERRYWQALTYEMAMARLADGFTVFGEGHRLPCAETYRVPAERIHALPNCVDPALFAPQPPDPALHGFGPDAQVLLFVGQVFRYKGCYELLDAFARIGPRHPRARLLFVGDVPPGEADAVRAAARPLGDRVRLAGPVPRARLPALMAASTAFVLPSHAEGTPRVMIEAMSVGLPLVGSRIPGIRALDPEERFIRFHDRGDARGLAAALDALLADPDDARARGEAGRARFVGHHTPEAAADALSALYERLTSG